MNKLSEHISQINNLKNKIISVSTGIYNKEVNTLQKSRVKALTPEEISQFEEFYKSLFHEKCHFEITNISNKRIKIILLKPMKESFPWTYASLEEEIVLHKETIRLKNIF